MGLLLDRGLRVSRETADVITGAAAPIFTITGGRVLLTEIVGEVTTAIQAAATNFRFVANPTVGTTTNLSADLEINGDEIGTQYSITGVAATATLVSSSGGVATMLAKGVILAPGAVEVVTSADRSGSMKFDARYIPLDDGAVMAAA